jgi:hypothetical protein
MSLATTTCDTFRGTQDNAAGDPIDDNSNTARVGAGWAVGIVERSKRVQDPSSGIWRSERYSVARFENAGRDVQVGDRLKDLTTSIVYYVDAVNRVPRTITGASKLSCDLSIVSNKAP